MTFDLELLSFYIQCTRFRCTEKYFQVIKYMYTTFNISHKTTQNIETGLIYLLKTR